MFDPIFLWIYAVIVIVALFVLFRLKKPKDNAAWQRGWDTPRPPDVPLPDLNWPRSVVPDPNLAQSTSVGVHAVGDVRVTAEKAPKKKKSPGKASPARPVKKSRVKKT